ncbi:hypothetical protein, partial [Exiguobacterium sp. A1_3_1]|uniref:hypothetical protein n=1 Tax=Exiguobacterium sp. A1_3_1 TaxID=2651871 RepID=UPI003B97DF23
DLPPLSRNKKNDASHATPTGKAHLCVVRDKQAPLSCLNEVGKGGFVSPEEMVCNDASFFF